MTSTNRTKTFARRLQAATGTPYATCRQQVEQWDNDRYGDWDEVAFQVANAEIATLTTDAAATLPNGAVQVTYQKHGDSPGSGPFIMVTHPGHSQHTCLDIAALDGYLGYIWRTDAKPVYVMANFLDADGQTITADTLVRTHATDLPRIREAITWLITQFAAHPDQYDDSARPTNIEAPIFE